MSEEEWGPWIDHDGKGCPVPIGTVVHKVYRGLPDVISKVGTHHYKSGSVFKGTMGPNNRWTWDSMPHWPEKHIIRYRVKKPKGLQILESLLQNLDDKINIDRPLCDVEV